MVKIHQAPCIGREISHDLFSSHMSTYFVSLLALWHEYSGVDSSLLIVRRLAFVASIGDYGPYGPTFRPSRQTGTRRTRHVSRRVNRHWMRVAIRPICRDGTHTRMLSTMPQRQLTFGQAQQMFSADEGERELVIKAAAEVFHKDGTTHFYPLS